VERLPDGFERRDGPGALIIGRRDLLPALCSLGLLDRDRLEASFADAPGEAGRGRTARISLEQPALRLVLRRLLHGGALAPLLGARFLGPGRPLRELIVTTRLREAGAPVPQAAAVIGHRNLGPLWTLAFATVEEPDAVDALRFLESDPDTARLRAAARAVGEAVRRFHDAGGRHADLHVKNVLIREQGERMEAVVIDLDRARLTPGLTPAERMSQVMRLYRSLRKRGVLEQLGPRGVSSFWSAYCGDDRGLRRAMWRRARLELRKIDVHALRYDERRGAD
jgi:tRNA A-37 threonylcarbamoyl transferase component Bud32